MFNIEDEINNIKKLDDEINLLESTKNKCKIILILLENENIEKIIKKNFFISIKDYKINYSKVILEHVKKSYDNEYNILYFLDYNLNLELNVLEDCYKNNYSITSNELKNLPYNNEIFDLTIIKNLNNIKNDNTNNFTNTDSKIIILKKKDKIYYIKNNKEKKNKTIKKRKIKQ